MFTTSRLKLLLWKAARHDMKQRCSIEIANIANRKAFFMHTLKAGKDCKQT